jgi:oligopeptide transport system substrate-binding protein
LAALTTFACRPLERDLRPAADTETLVYNMETQPRSIDPGNTSELISGSVISHAFEGLTTLGVGMTTEPGVAERWEISEDGLTYDFFLRDNAFWNDGQAVRAQDFEHGWKRVLDPELGSIYAFILMCIEGAEAYYEHEGSEEERPSLDTIGVEVVNDQHLRVHLARPTPYFLQLTSFMTYMPVRRDIVEEHGDTWAINAESYVGNGLYRVTEYERGYQIRFEINPLHRDAETTAIKTMVWYMISESQAEYIAYLTNSIDMSYGVPYPDLPEIRETLPGHLNNAPWIGIYYVGFNFREGREAFQDVRVRRAFALALDRERIAAEVTEGTRPGAETYIPPGVPDADGSDFAANAGPLIPNYLPDEARRLMAEAGYPDGQGFPPVTYLYNTDVDHARIAEFMQAAWRRELNVDVQLENQEWQVYLQNSRDGNFDFGRRSWLGDYVDPMTFLDIWMTDNSSNRNKYSNPEFDALVEQAWYTSDREEYFRLCHEAEHSLCEDGALIPMYHYTNTYLRNPALEGVYVTPSGVQLFHDARWNEEMIEGAGK